MATLDLSKLGSLLSANPKKLQPILTSLNGDNSWLFSFPRPAAERASSSKAYFHIVSDPWLSGPAIVFYAMLLKMELHNPPPFVSGGDGVAHLVHQIEETAAMAGLVSPEAWRSATTPAVDAICIHKTGPDHVHEDTLRTFPSSIPVFATPETAPHVKALSHFETVITMNQPKSASDADWRSLHPGTPLPPWLNVFPLMAERQNFTWAIVYTGDGADSQPEAIVSAPHGFKGAHPAVGILPDVSVLAILFPLKESYSFGIHTVYGVTHGLDLCRQLTPTYYVPTHNAHFTYSGILPVTDVRHSFEWGVEQTPSSEDWKAPSLADIKNGQSFVLT